MRMFDGIPVYGEPSDRETLEQAKRCAADPRAAWVGLMADNHRGYAQPIGGVVAYRNAVSPAGVGYDIGCGNNAVLTDLTAADLGVVPGLLGRKTFPEVERAMDAVWRTVEFGMGSKTRIGGDHPIFDDPRWTVTPAVEALKALARSQIGSVGAGNHYVDLFLDEHDRLWVGNHFGSRGFGHKTATGFLNLAAGRRWDTPSRGESMDAAPRVLDLDTPTGADYWTAMSLAGDYATAGRDLVLEQVLDVLGARGLEWVRNNHNLAWRERHLVDGVEQDLVVVRKGATPAFPGQLGFVGGSMGDDAVIVRGVDTADARAGLYSTVHGAGRVMSRTQAAGRKNWRTGERSGGKVTREMMLDWVRKKGVVLRGAGTDEAPHCYKRLDAVLRAHEGAIELVHRLRPIGVAMAGPDVRDPYKD
jgi:tRNA-splicing ligase RtcB